MRRISNSRTSIPNAVSRYSFRFSSSRSRVISPSFHFRQRSVHGPGADGQSAAGHFPDPLTNAVAVLGLLQAEKDVKPGLRHGDVDTSDLLSIRVSHLSPRCIEILFILYRGSTVMSSRKGGREKPCRLKTERKETTSMKTPLRGLSRGWCRRRSSEF